LQRTHQALFDGHARKKLCTGQGNAPVLIGSWNGAKERKILAILDPIAALAEANQEEALETLLDQVATKSAALQSLLADLATQSKVGPEVTAGQTDSADVPLPPDEATTQLGDLRLLGNHRPLCGNSSKTEYLDRLLSGAPVHLVNTYPPNDQCPRSRACQREQPHAVHPRSVPLRDGGFRNVAALWPCPGFRFRALFGRVHTIDASAALPGVLPSALRDRFEVFTNWLFSTISLCQITNCVLHRLANCAVSRSSFSRRIVVFGRVAV
jgi:hypothetical protein